MQPKHVHLIVASFGTLAPLSHAAVIFSQDFSASTIVSDYVSATPDAGQFNSIGSSGAGVTTAISSGALTFSRTGANTGTFSRTTDFNPLPTGLTYAFSLTVSGATASTTSAAVFQVGSAFTTGSSSESNGDTYARFAINLSATAGDFSIRDITNGSSSAAFTGTQQIFWVLNNTGASFNYTAPDASVVSLPNDLADLWIGNTKVLNGVAVQTASQTLSDLKFSYSSGTATIAIDNLVISEIPEPSSIFLTVLSGFGLFRRRRR